MKNLLLPVLAIVLLASCDDMNQKCSCNPSITDSYECEQYELQIKAQKIREAGARIESEILSFQGTPEQINDFGLQKTLEFNEEVRNINAQDICTLR